MMRREHENAGGQSKCLLVDCCDTFEGSFEDAATEVAIMLPVFNSLPYRTWTLYQN